MKQLPRDTRLCASADFDGCEPVRGIDEVQLPSVGAPPDDGSAVAGELALYTGYMRSGSAAKACKYNSGLPVSSELNAISVPSGENTPSTSWASECRIGTTLPPPSRSATTMSAPGSPTHRLSDTG